MSEDTLTQIRTQGERLFSSLEREFYSNLRGLSKKSSLEDIYNSHREFGEPGLFKSINGLLTAEDGNNAGLKLLSAFLAETFVMSRASSLTDRVLSLESSSVLKIGKKRIPYRSATQNILNEPNKQKRDEIQNHRTEAQEKLIPYLLEILYVTAGASESLGYSNYSELKEYADGVDITSLSNEAKLFIRDTDYISKEMLDWFFTRRMGFPLKDSNSADVAFMLNSFELKAAYSEKDYTVCAAKVLDDSGLVNSTHVSVDSEKRKGKAPGGIFFPILPPFEMAVSIFPAGGPADYEYYFGALGRALSYAFTDRGDDFEYRCLRDPVQTEIFSELFKNLIFERKWLDRYIDFERGEDFYKLLFLRRLMCAREEARRLIYEVALYSGESIDNLQDTYKEIMEEALHTRVSGLDFLTTEDIREPLRSVSRFKACLIEPCLSKRLRETYDEEWWREKDAGVELKNIWSEGGRYRSDEVSGTSGFDGTAAELRRVFERELS